LDWVLQPGKVGYFNEPLSGKLIIKGNKKQVFQQKEYLLFLLGQFIV